MKKDYTLFTIGAACITLFSFGPAAGQAPVLTATAPGRNANNAARTGPIALTFSQAVAGASGIRVSGSQQHGSRTGAASGDGTATLQFQPTRALLPGELVSVSVPATVHGTGAAPPALANGQVVQFRAAAGPGTGVLAAGPSNVGYSNGLYFRNPTLADIDNDGRLDLLTQDPTSNTLNLRFGTGTGAFGAPVTPPFSAIPAVNPQDLVVADFNSDGNLDVVTNAPGGATRVLTVSLGDGQGHFTAAPSVPVSSPAFAVQTADLNADGNLDLVFLESSPTATVLTVKPGNGQGGFTSLPALPLDAGTGGMKVVDVNNDGILDCVIANSYTGLLKTYLGTGQGSFALASPPPAAIPSTGTPIPSDGALPVAADLTGDGLMDVLVLDFAANSVRLYPGTGQGGFGAATAISATNLGGVTVADVDADGDLDLLVVSVGSAPSSTNPNRPAYVRLNNGSGVFGAATPLASPATQVVAGDINNDGTIDVVLLDERGNSNGTGFYTYLSQRLATAPQLTTFSPTTGTAGTVVTITGTNFTGATAVLIDGVLVSGFTVVNGTTITFPLPAGGFSGLITVITPSGTATSTTAFRTTLAVRASAGTMLVEVFPNPTHGVAQLRLPGVGAVQVDGYNALGQRLLHAQLRPQAGGVALDVSSLAPGLYTLRLTQGTGVAVRQLLVE